MPSPVTDGVLLVVDDENHGNLDEDWRDGWGRKKPRRLRKFMPVLGRRQAACDKRRRAARLLKAGPV
jgi:hypothetical protein